MCVCVWSSGSPYGGLGVPTLPTQTFDISENKIITETINYMLIYWKRPLEWLTDTVVT